MGGLIAIKSVYICINSSINMTLSLISMNFEASFPSHPIIVIDLHGLAHSVSLNLPEWTLWISEIICPLNLE